MGELALCISKTVGNARITNKPDGIERIRLISMSYAAVLETQRGEKFAATPEWASDFNVGQTYIVFPEAGQVVCNDGSPLPATHVANGYRNVTPLIAGR